jgi:hypothetical protein
MNIDSLIEKPLKFKQVPFADPKAGKKGRRRSSTRTGPKLFKCTGYGDCNMVFTRSEHLARHERYGDNNNVDDIFINYVTNDDPLILQKTHWRGEQLLLFTSYDVSLLNQTPLLFVSSVYFYRNHSPVSYQDAIVHLVVSIT